MYGRDDRDLFRKPACRRPPALWPVAPGARWRGAPAASRRWSKAPGILFTGIAALALGTILAAAAQQRPEPGAGKARAAAGSPQAALQGQLLRQPPRSFGVATLLGADVVAQDGRPVGELKDVLVTEDGRVAAILLGLGGFLGFGDKVVAVRIGQVTITRIPGVGRVLVTAHFSPRQLDQAPEFRPRAAQPRRATAEPAR